MLHTNAGSDTRGAVMAGRRLVVITGGNRKVFAGAVELVLPKRTTGEPA